MLGVPTTASARPAGYGSAACNPGGTNVCAYDSVHDTWKCDLANITTGTSAATAWMIHGEIDAASTACGNVCDGNPYCSFGVRNDVKYYCDLDEGVGAGSTMVEGWLIGTPGADWLSFWYEDAPTITCVMENAGLDVTKVTGKILGGSADDDIFGSTQSNDSTYQDSLWGDSGKDTIMSFAGSDLIHGGSGNDDINSGTGDDVIFGEDDADNISSGEDDDLVYGGPGVDQICTDGGNDDVAHGGDDADQIWDITGSNDWAYGDDGIDFCNSTNEVSCEYEYFYRPASCPAEVTPYR